MFGIPKSINILNKINSFSIKDKRNKKYRIIVTPPFTLIESFAKKFKNKNIIIGSQNCYHKLKFSSDTAAISPFMLKSVGARYTLIGHSDNRKEGDTDAILKEKINFALQNKLKIVFCIGENKTHKKNNKTFGVLKKQLLNVLEKRNLNKNNIIIAYEPIWSIGTGITPDNNDLSKTINFIKSVLGNLFKKKSPPVLYGGSVDEISVQMFKQVKEIDGFLIGGASKSSKKFIDIIKNYYR